jgi:CRISPR-associated protein, SAG0894
LDEFDNKPEKAFGDPSNPVYKPTKNGSLGNIVRSIKVYDTQNSKSGFLINEGKAFVNNGDTIRLDVFKRKNYKGEFEYYFSPIYAHLLNAKKVEILPTPNGRSAAEKADFNKIRDENGKIFATEENGFVKQFSLYPNDYVRIYAKKQDCRGLLC